jgi:4a-hydroxytetrahydrobiopterin dehydratase
MGKLTGRQIADEALDGWVNLGGVLGTRIRTTDFAGALALVDAIGAAAEELDHHPDIAFGWGRVDIRLTSHDAGGVTERDVKLARVISALAEDANLEPESDNAVKLELALDSPAFEGVLPFWRAVLRLEDGAAPDEVVDPSGALPSVWFQASGDEPDRQRWHFDLWVEPSEVQPRIEAALAAGGTLDSDANAPSFWILADPEGNKVCLCTWQDRG